MPSPLSIALAEYTRAARRAASPAPPPRERRAPHHSGVCVGDRYSTRHHGDWIVHRTDSADGIVLRSTSETHEYAFVTSAQLGTGGLQGFRRL